MLPGPRHNRGLHGERVAGGQMAGEAVVVYLIGRLKGRYDQAVRDCRHKKHRQQGGNRPLCAGHSCAFFAGACGSLAGLFTAPLRAGPIVSARRPSRSVSSAIVDPVRSDRKPANFSDEGDRFICGCGYLSLQYCSPLYDISPQSFSSQQVSQECAKWRLRSNADPTACEVLLTLFLPGMGSNRPTEGATWVEAAVLFSYPF